MTEISETVQKLAKTGQFAPAWFSKFKISSVPEQQKLIEQAQRTPPLTYTPITLEQKNLLRSYMSQDLLDGLTFADLKGKRIGMENGTTHQKYIQDQHPEVKTVSYDSYQNAFIDLKNGRIDGVFGDTAVVNEWLKTNPQLGVATEKVTDPQYFGTGLGIAVRPDNKALLEKLNNALAAIKADGTYQKINDQWFPQ